MPSIEPASEPVKSHADILAELYGQKCQCGKKKAAGATFCPKCIGLLPMELYRQLLGGGTQYYSAYAIALGYLDGLVRLKKETRSRARRKRATATR